MAAIEEWALYELLIEAIPKKELEELMTWPRGSIINGGIVRGSVGLSFPHSRSEIIATYNNTRKDQSEIVRWFRDAKALAQARGV